MEPGTKPYANGNIFMGEDLVADAQVFMEEKISSLEELKRIYVRNQSNAYKALLDFTSDPSEKDANISESVLVEIREKPYISQNLLHLRRYLGANLYRASFISRIHSLLGDLNRIGEDSVYGQVFHADFIQKFAHDRESHFAHQREAGVIIKTNKKPEDVGEIYNEYLNGLLLNNLRQDIPSFYYVYGLMSCSAPKTENNEVQFCTEMDSRYAYLIGEEITDQVKIRDIIARDLDSCLLLLIQVYLALAYAYNEYGFVHNDLHPGNILVRKLSGVHELRYPFFSPVDGKYIDIYIKTDFYPVIIDYGMSSSFFTYKGKSCQNASIATVYNISLMSPVRCSPLTDLLKPLFFMDEFSSSTSFGSTFANFVDALVGTIFGNFDFRSNMVFYYRGEVPCLEKYNTFDVNTLVGMILDALPEHIFSFDSDPNVPHYYV